MRLLLVVMALSLGAGDAWAQPVPGRTLASTGDRTTSGDTLGTLGATVLGIDDNGRVLLHAGLTDGIAALAWVDDARRDVIWRSKPNGDAEPPINPFSAVTSPSGNHVMAFGGHATGGDLFTFARLYELEKAGSARVRLAAGDVTGSWRIRGMTQAHVADDGSFVVWADVRRADDSEDDAFRPALVIVSDAGTSVIASQLEGQAAERRLTVDRAFGIAPGGLVAFEATYYTGPCCLGLGTRVIMRGTAQHVEPLLSSDQPGPDGERFDYPIGQAMDRNGEVLVSLCENESERHCTLYRSAASRWVRVAGEDDPDAPAGPFSIFAAALNARGDTAVSIGLHGEQYFRPAVVLYPAEGGARIVSRSSNQYALNEGGDVAVTSPFDEPATAIGRWRDGNIEPLFGIDDHLAGGGRPLANGLTPVCLASDGRVGARATFSDGGQGWVCLDARGTHVVSRGGTTAETVNCGFADDQMIVLGDGVDRLSDGGAESVLKPGTALPDGSSIVTIRALDTNASGTLAAAVITTRADAVIRQRRGAAMEMYHLTGDDGDLTAIVAVGIADDDTAVAFGSQSGAGAAIVTVAPNGATRTIALDTGEGGYVDAFFVRGHRLLLGKQLGDGAARLRVLDLVTDEWSTLLESPPSTDEATYVYHFTGAGTVLLQTYSFRDGSSEFVRLADGRRTTVYRDDGTTAGRVFALALNDRGNALFSTIDSPGGAYLSGIALGGPGTAKQCPGTAQSSGAESGGGCQVAQPSSASVTQLAFAGLLMLICGVGARRRRVEYRARHTG